MKKHVLVICYSDLAQDARVLRQIGELVRAGYVVSTAANTPSNLENGTFTRIHLEEYRHLGTPVPIRKFFSLAIRARNSSLRTLGAHACAYWTGFRKTSLRRLREVGADLIIANDIDTLPLALALKRPGTKVIFDAHEFSPLQGEGDRQWMASFHARNTYLCKRYMPMADHCFTVSPEIADRYLTLTSVKPSLLTNAPDFVDQLPVIHENGPVELVHHGIATRQRETHKLALMMDALGPGYRMHFHLLGTQDPEYVRMVLGICSERRNIVVHGPIAPTEISNTIAQYDIGVHRLPTHSTNHQLALPNKFFEFIQARLAVVISPSPSMAKIVHEEGIGAVASDHTIEGFILAIRTLDRDKINACKLRSHAIASTYSARGNMHLLRNVVMDLIGPSDPFGHAPKEDPIS
jgi:hypothetical protein